jgi:carotenoid isomerooxygenase
MNQCKTLAKIPARWPFNPSYMHTFAVTDNFIILIEQSLCISLTQLIQLTITHGPMTDALIWHENEPVCKKKTFSQKNCLRYLGSISSY